MCVSVRIIGRLNVKARKIVQCPSQLCSLLLRNFLKTHDAPIVLYNFHSILPSNNHPHPSLSPPSPVTFLRLQREIRGIKNRSALQQRSRGRAASSLPAAPAFRRGRTASTAATTTTATTTAATLRSTLTTTRPLARGRGSGRESRHGGAAASAASAFHHGQSRPEMKAFAFRD